MLLRVWRKTKEKYKNYNEYKTVPLSTAMQSKRREKIKRGWGGDYSCDGSSEDSDSSGVHKSFS